MVASLKFFLGTDPDENKSDDSDSEVSWYIFCNDAEI